MRWVGAALAAILLVVGLWMSGLFDPKQDPPDIVARPQAEVMDALADLDIAKQPWAPGGPGSGTPRLDFKLVRGRDTMTWTLISGGKLATRMTAQFAPVDGGAKTRVSTSIYRGDVPDELLPPSGVLAGLFAMAVRQEIEALTIGPWDARCDALFQQMMQEDSDAMTDQLLKHRWRDRERTRPREPAGASLDKVTAMEVRLREQGCAVSQAPSRNEWWTPPTSLPLPGAGDLSKPDRPIPSLGRL